MISPGSTVRCGTCGKEGHNARTCGRPPCGSPEDRKARAARARRLGLCQPCAIHGRDRDARPGKATCEEHATKLRRSGIQIRKRRAAKGQCYRCTKPAKKGRFCAEHAAKNNAYPRRNTTRERKIREGICITSTCENSTFVHRKCAECRRLDSEATLARQNAFIAKGLCRCGRRPVDEPGKSCDVCIRKRRRKRGITTGPAAPAARPAASGSTRAPG